MVILIGAGLLEVVGLPEILFGKYQENNSVNNTFN